MNLTWLYVGVLYALAVWLARRGGIDLKPRVAAFFYVLVLLFLWKPMTQRYVNVPVDYLQQLPPWTLISQGRAQNEQINDITLQMLPWAHEAREQWKSLRLPVWNGAVGSGYPLLANGQSAPFSLIRILCLPLELGRSFTAEAAFKFLIALTFTFLYCRRRGYSELASTIGAISFGFCSFLSVWLHFPHATVAAMLPAIIYALDLLAERVTHARFTFAALAWAIVLYGGHPETASHIFFFALLLVIWILAVERPFDRRGAIRFLAALTGVMIVAALIASPFLATFAEAVTKSQRYQQLQVVHPGIAFTDFRSAVLLFQPMFYGQVPTLDPHPWGPALAESICGFAGILGIAGWLTLLMDSIRSRRFRSRELLFIVALPVMLGIILDWQLISRPFHLIFALAANGRIRLLLCFVTAILAAAAIDRAPRVLLAGIAIVAAAMLALFIGTPFPSRFMRDTAVLAMLPSISVLLLATLSTVQMRFRRFVLIALAIAVTGELWSAGRSWNPDVGEEWMYPRTPMIAKLQQLKAQQPATAPFRIVGVGGMLFPNIASIYGLEDVRAHDPMANGRYMGTLRVLTGYDSSQYFAQWLNIETRVIDYLNVKYLLIDPRFEVKDRQRFRPVYNARDGAIYENRDVLPRFYPVSNVLLEFRNELFISRLRANRDWPHTAVLHKLWVNGDRMRSDLLAPRPASAPGATLQIVEASPTRYRLRVDAPRWTLVVSSLPWWPGWRVTQEGSGSLHKEQVNSAFLGFTVPPGRSDIVVSYVPLTFYIPLALSLLTLAALFGARWWRRGEG